MRFLDYIRLAIKNLTRQKSRTILTVIAITVGSLSVILMLSLLISVRMALIDQFKNLGAFDLVTVAKDPNATDNGSLINTNGDPSEGKKIDDTTLTQMKALPHVSAVTPVITSMGFSTMRLESETKKSWANIMAYDPNNDVYNLPVKYGRKLTSADMDKIVIGQRFLEEAKYKGNPKDLIGKKVVLNSKMGGAGSGPDWGELPAKPPANADKSWYESQSKNGLDIEAEIVGISDNGTIDNGQSYITLAWARRLMVQVSWQWSETDKNNCDQNGCQSVMTLTKDDRFTTEGYNSIIIKVDDTKNITLVADAVKALGYGANTAQDMLDEINRIMLMIGLVLAAIGGISLFVAAIGIINTMVMATYERIREIGVMRACGATRAVIRRLFTFEAAILGLLGGVFGVALCYGIIYIAKILVTKYSSSLGSLPIDQIGNIPWWLIISVLAFTTLVGLLSGLGPAIKAAKLNPVEALRYE